MAVAEVIGPEEPSRRIKEAPVFVRAYDLLSWLLDRLDGAMGCGDGPAGEEASFPELARSVLRHSGRLLNALSLAVARFDRGMHLVEADEQAALLRIHLRLASEKKLLEDRQLLYASGELSDIGRQAARRIATPPAGLFAECELSTAPPCLIVFGPSAPGPGGVRCLLCPLPTSLVRR